MHISGPETRPCPPEFQERVTRKFGTNPFGEPNYKIAWTHSQFIRMGNIWRDKFGNERRVYKDRYQVPTACWCIYRWRSSREYGSPEAYYAYTHDKVSGLYNTGEYPWKGRYEPLQPLYAKEMVNGKLVIDHWELSHQLIDRIIPILIEAQRMSFQERLVADELARQERHKKEVAMVAEHMMEGLPTWMGPVSYGRQGCRTSLLDRKMQAIEKIWNRVSRRIGRRPQFQRGLQQGNAPRFIN